MPRVSGELGFNKFSLFRVDHMKRKQNIANICEYFRLKM